MQISFVRTRGFLTKFVRVYAFVCSCLSKVYCYVYCVQDDATLSRSIDVWNVQTADRRWPLIADETGIFLDSHCSTSGRSGEKTRILVCMCVVSKCRTCVSCIFTYVYMYVCVLYTRVRQIALVCISFGRSLTLRFNNAR